MKKTTILFCIISLNLVLGQQTPANEQTQNILITNAFIHIGDGTTIENGSVSFSDGIINYVGENISKEDSFPLLLSEKRSRVINANGKHIYPGFIAINSTLGLVEIDAVRASDDEDELGDFLPHIRSAIAYNAESKVVESVRPNGVLIAQIVPRGGTISGSSSVMQLDAWNWEDALLKSDEGIHLNWPSPYSRGRWWLGEDPSLKENKDYSKSTTSITNFFEESKVYSGQKPKHLPYSSMKGVFDGSKTMYLHASYEKQIVDGVSFLKEQKIKNIVLVHGEQSINQIKYLKDNNIPVIISRPHRLPDNEDHDPKLTFKLAKKLIEKGIIVSIDPSGQMERMNTRNLPFYAGSFSAYGVDKEEALKMITINAAKILGIDKQLGSLEVGKDATLFVSKGDALDMRTNILSNAFINGREISLETHQTELWKRYSKKFSTQK
jgi:imidazolonepropionase-like amidohydrolase